jgi:hypothetical protein
MGVFFMGWGRGGVTSHFGLHEATPLLSHTSLIMKSSKEGVKICIYQYIKNTIKVQIS